MVLLRSPYPHNSPPHHLVLHEQLVDFGLGAKFTDEDETFREDVGSIYYVAPEVLGRKYTKVKAVVELAGAL